jgi:LacI family transcriptional regulator
MTSSKTTKSARRKTRVPRVAVLVDTATSWGRRIHCGIHDYARQHGSWRLFFEARGIEERLRVPTGWQGDGIIARVGSVAMARELEALGMPVVNVSGIELPGTTFPRVTTDLSETGQVAVSHFHERGFRHFAFFSLRPYQYVATLQRSFSDAVARTFGDLACFAVETRDPEETNCSIDLAEVGQWARSLCKPVGILTCNPSSAREIVYACDVAGLLVPEEVAVLSSSDDELLCDMLDIPISGILPDTEQIGWKAAELLDRLMRRGKVPAEPVLIPPRGIATRQSTDSLAIRDSALAKALNYIRQHAAFPIQIDDIARHAGVCRRVLERRFIELDRSPIEEIRRVRLERAKQLLVETGMSIPDVADASGFGSPAYLSHTFQKELHTTPKKYRQEGSQFGSPRRMP